MSTKHTPGPWKITCMADENRLLIETDGYVICQINDPTGGPDDENARLIASAPILLEALEDLERRYSDELYGLDLMQVRGAIATAKGGIA